jgi:hypothetical protein
MTHIFTAAAAVQSFIESKGWGFCFIGGLALQRWGDPRHTQDVDLTLMTGFGGEEPFVAALAARFKPRYADAVAFALQRRVLMLVDEEGVPIDVAFGALPFEEGSVQRSSLFRTAGNLELRTCSAEDLIVHKVFAGRSKDWMDVEGILIRQNSRLDHGLIESELKPLLELKEDAASLSELRQLKAKIDRALRDL